MSISATVTQTNGEFVNNKSEINFENLSGSYTYQKNQICKVSVTDSENSANNLTDIPVLALDGTYFLKYYRKSTGTWELFGATKDLTGYNIVVKRQSNLDRYDIYFAYDDQLSLIPNFNEEMRIRYRLTSKINSDNLYGYKRFDLNGGVKVPIVPLTIAKFQSRIMVNFLAAEIGQNNNISLYTAGVDLGSTANAYGNEIMRLPTFSSFIELANSEITDLDTRVSILESKVQTLEAKVAEHDQVLKDLPAIVSAVSENVSKLYVAR